MTDVVELGVLGTGAIAQIVHLPLLSQMPGVSVSAVCDVNQSKAQAIAGRFEVPSVYRSDDEVFSDPDIQGVIICSPSHLHETQAIAALEGGKHVLVEKPLALTPDGAERVIAAAEQAGREVMVAMNNRYRADARAMRTFVTNGELGEPFLVKGGLLNRKVRVLRPTWRHRRATSGGGALMDLGVQILDLCLWTLGYPDVARVMCRTHPGEDMEVEDAGALLLETSVGTTVSVEATWSLLASRDRQYLQVLATRGSATLSPLSVHKEVEHGLLDVTPQFTPAAGNMYTATYEELLEHFVAVVAGRAQVEKPRDQVRLMRLIELAYRSAESGEVVEG